jgi:tetratricopeptide (TPR) repeat protein
VIAGVRTPILIAATVLAIHLTGLWGVFQFDDHNVIVLNPVVHSLAAWLADIDSGIRPLLKLSYTLNWILGPGELGFHWVNVGIHVVNTLLVYALVRMRYSTAAAAIAALLFGLHPAQTEAVTYISGRSASLMTMFYLGGMLAYAAGSLHGQRFLLYFVSPALFVLALATKEVAVTFAFAVLLWEATRGASLDWKEIARKQAAHWIVFFAAVAALLLHPGYGARLVSEFDPGYRNLLTQIDAAGYLVLRLACVYPLNIDPDLRVVPGWSASLALKAALLAALLAFGLRALKRRPWWSLGILWFFLHLLPTNSLLPRLDIANDRHLYLAGVGVFAAVGVELDRLQPRLGAAGWRRALLAAIVVVLGGLTVLRNGDYASEIGLWKQTARVSPQKPRVYNNLGFAYSAAGCVDEAERAYRQALRLDPAYAVARDNLASLRERKESTRDAAICPPS